MTKKIMSLFTILVLLGAPTIIIADEALLNSTTEWLGDDIGSDDFSADGYAIADSVDKKSQT